MTVRYRAPVKVGLERCLTEPPQFLADGAKFGLLMNQASVTSDYGYACDVLDVRFPNQLVTLFSPQHGLWCEQQANMIESQHAIHPKLGLPIYSLYAELREPTSDMLRGLDVLVIDLQDVGTRVYTFIWTVVNCLRACKSHSLPVVLLDRPNPIGGEAVEGPILQSAFRSFVGLADIPMRHSLTLGELAMFCNARLKIDADLQIVPVTGWQRPRHLPHTTAPWCPPSPNMPRYETALVYPGQVLLEGTNLSEGRGTTVPFEVVGAPFINAERLASQLNERALSAVYFRPLRFIPTFDKWVGQRCEGVYIHVLDPVAFQAYATTIEILRAVKRLCPSEFAWLPPPYEYEFVKPPIDILSGSEQLRRALDTSDDRELDACITVDRSGWLTDTKAFRIY
jgi:uncharacterized protein YbbC (DUF1343 family)